MSVDNKDFLEKEKNKVSTVNNGKKGKNGASPNPTDKSPSQAKFKYKEKPVEGQDEKKE